MALAPFSCFVEFGFVVLASRTAPIIREVLERRSRRDIPAWIADRWVIYVTAYRADVLPGGRFDHLYRG